MRQRLKATREIHYAGKTRPKDSEFDVEAGDEANGRLLVLIGHATEVGGAPKTSKLQTRAMEAESTQPEVAQLSPTTTPVEPMKTGDDGLTPQRRYQRRDMQAKK